MSDGKAQIVTTNEHDKLKAHVRKLASLSLHLPNKARPGVPKLPPLGMLRGLKKPAKPPVKHNMPDIPKVANTKAPVVQPVPKPKQQKAKKVKIPKPIDPNKLAKPLVPPRKPKQITPPYVPIRPEDTYPPGSSLEAMRAYDRSANLRAADLLIQERKNLIDNKNKKAESILQPAQEDNWRKVKPLGRSGAGTGFKPELRRR